MAVNIPMPGIDRSGLFEGLVQGNQAKFQRNQLEQQWQQHLQDLAIRQQQQQRLAEQFELEKQFHPFKIQAAQQQQQMGPLNLDLLKAQIENQRAMANQRSPEYEQKKFQNMLNMFSQMGQQGGQQAPQQQGQPSAQPQGQQSFNAPNQEQIMRGVMKKHFGFDPFAPTEEQKTDRRLKEFQQKEQIKQQMKGSADLTAPTKSTTTLNQGIINAANNIIPQIKQLQKLDVPHQQFKSLSPTQQQKYLAMTNSIADGLMSAYALPRTDQSLHMVKQMVQRGDWESDEGYKDRLKILTKELESRRDAASDILKGGKVKIVNHNEDNDPWGIRQ